MPTPDYLSGTDEIEPQDLITVWSRRNRDARRVSFGQFQDGIDATVQAALTEPVESANAAAALAQAASGAAATSAQAAVDALAGAAKKTELATPATLAIGGFTALEAQSILDNALPMESYAALRAYSGRALGFRVTAPGLDGSWLLDAADTTSADNGGTILVRADGKRVKRLFSGSVYTSWFGAKGDWNGTTGTDDTDAIQRTLDYACFVGFMDVVISGRSKISGPLHVGYGVGFRTLNIRGLGQMYRGETGFSGSALIATHSNAPAICVQGMRIASIKSISLIGANYDYVKTNRLGDIDNPPTLDDTDINNWFSPSLDSRANSRYAPYAGIAIDPYAGTRPATSYPDVNYPVAYVGAQPQYGKSFSSMVTLEDVFVAGFTVPVVGQPCDADGNGDYLKIQRCNFSHCPYMVSIGNTQSRNVYLDSPQFGYFHTALTNNKHGRQSGKFGGAIVNGSFNLGIQLFDFNTLFAGPISWTNCYGEALWKLGKYGSGTANSALSMNFQSCEFKLTNQSDARGVPAQVIEGGTPCPLTFDNVIISGMPSVAMLGGSIGSYSIKGLKVESPNNPRTQTYEKLAHNFLAGGVMFQVVPTSQKPAEFSAAMGRRFNITTGVSTGTPLGPIMTTKREFPVGAWSQWATPSDQPGYIVTAPTLWTFSGKAAFSTITLTGKTLTLVFTAARGETVFAKDGPFPGDVIFDDDSRSVFFVSAVDLATKTVTAILQNNYKLVSGAYQPVTPFSTSTGSLYFGNSRVYLPTYFLRGDTLTSSATISNVARDDDFSTWIDAAILVGDFVFINEQTDRWVLPLLSKVAAVSGSGKTITLSGNPSRALTNKALGYFIRQPPANV